MQSITTPAMAVDPLPVNINPEHISLPVEKKKKKKRSREDDQASPHERKESKKKRKHVNPDPEELEEPSSAAAVDSDAPAKKKKKKKKDKGKAKAKSAETALADQTDAEIEANSHASAAALLSAIVAASVTNSEAPQMPVPPGYDPRLIPASAHFMPYPPPMHFGFPMAPPGTFDPSAPQPSNAFPGPPPHGNTFSELSFGSNEEVLRALQELDMSKIANVLRTLGDAPTAPQLSFTPQQLDQLSPPDLQQLATSSNALLGVPAKSNAGHKRLINMAMPGNEQPGNINHAHLLANKWLGASKLAELVRTEGLVYKKGKFSAIEEHLIRSAVANIQHVRQLSDQELLEIIFSKNDKNRDTAFWSELTAAVPLRPIIAVYHHVRRSYHPMKQQGPWKPDEDDLLKQAVADLGQQWEKVSSRVGRMASDCRDRYRNHLLNRDIRITGPWSKEEEDQLTQIVTDMTVKQGKDVDNDVFWSKVSELMGGRRGRQQCRIKWTDALSKTMKNEGQKPRWSQQDAFILVHKVDSLNVRDDTEIDWKLISDADWNLWSAHTLQRRWLTLKKSVKGYEEMTHQEIMDILRIKKAHLPPPPPPPSTRKRERKVTSAPSVNEPDSRDSHATTPEAGPSNGPGTASEESVVERQLQEDDSTDSDS
ncbi:unnamed protein product [Cyclocybe aegerita]|uniref:Uncharacterized protein n=1 Tax=Cyclocybe aegerita TaxID=1973307 RepID=A0A8S0VTD8_CYCAE|nr:unnamed protein product [Cyclocybe aegerita]